MTTQTDASPFKAQGLRIVPPPTTSAVSPQGVRLHSPLIITPHALTLVSSPITSAVSPARHFNFEPNRQDEGLQAENEKEKFVERKHFRTEIFEYERNGDDPGLILIFNQETFINQTLGTRKGSRRDVNEIAICFQRQGFNVDINNIFTDFTTTEIRDKLTEVAARDLSNYNCLIIFFLSHGEEFNRLDTKDGTIAADEIWGRFKRIENFANKPKMFIFQACKGEGFSVTGTSKISPPPLTPSVIAPPKTFSANYLSSDLLIVYSSVEGNSSYRNSLTGSWFIQELCKNFSAYGKRDDVVSMIIRTTKCVCGNYYHNKDKVDQKQMPFFVSTLRKKFYLNRNKDRDIAIRIAESNEEILKMLKEVKKQLDLLLDEDKKKKK